LFDNIIPKLKLGKLLGMIDPAFVSVFAKMFIGPFSFGHECIAEVIETGDKVKHIKVGDVVSVPFQLSCGICIVRKKLHLPVWISQQYLHIVLANIYNLAVSCLTF
jgi:hypothetical protein